MSYVLDALRKADAQRERGGVPGLHARPMPTMPTDAGARGGPRPWVWAALGATIVVVALLVWRLVSPPPDAGVAVSGPVSVPAPAAGPTRVPDPGAPASAEAPAAPPSVAPAPAAALAPPVTAPPVSAPAARASQTPAHEAAVPRPAAAPARTSPPAPAPAPPASAPAASVAAAPAPPASGAPARPPSTATSQQIYSLRELPEPVRRELPDLKLGGAMYAENPANRMLIYRDQLLREGHELSAGLVLAEIRLHEAVFEYKGIRFRVPY